MRIFKFNGKHQHYLIKMDCLMRFSYFDEFTLILITLLLIDDQMVDLLNSPFMETFFCATSHHFNNSIFFTLQNYYSSSRSKTILRQCIYKIIFNDPGDRILIRNISCAVSPNAQFLSKCFKMLEQKFPSDLHYLLIDTNPRSAMKQMVVRSRIFPNSSNQIKPICFFP